MDHLPADRASAATQMATDWLLLTAYPRPGEPRFRHYGWSEPAYTFGFAQNWGPQLEALQNQGYAVVRRETGGGLVDHQKAWTYTVVLPPQHPMADLATGTLYLECHQTVVQALRQQGVAATLESRCPGPAPAFRDCFQQLELHDVVDPQGHKLAGAAQRRNRHGILIQGYLDLTHCPQVDGHQLAMDLAEAMATALRSPRQPVPTPTWPQDLFVQTCQRFARDAWNHRRRR